jgi:hypothetical protein
MRQSSTRYGIRTLTWHHHDDQLDYAAIPVEFEAIRRTQFS